MKKIELLIVLLLCSCSPKENLDKDLVLKDPPVNNEQFSSQSSKLQEYFSKMKQADPNKTLNAVKTAEKKADFENQMRLFRQNYNRCVSLVEKKKEPDVNDCMSELDIKWEYIVKNFPL